VVPVAVAEPPAPFVVVGASLQAGKSAASDAVAIAVKSVGEGLMMVTPR
jgi:hypothetical protein